MRTIGIREFKDGLSRFLKEVRTGEVIFLTDRGRIVAELRPAHWPAGHDEAGREERYRRLVESGFVRSGSSRSERGWKWTDYALDQAAPPGTVEELLEESRRDWFQEQR